MSISLNIHGQNVKDRPRLLRFLADTKPRAVLVMDSFDLAKQIKAQQPDTIVIYRAWPDDGIHTQLSPEEWVNRKVSELGGADLWAYTTNEPGFSDVVLNWTSEVIELAAAKGLKVVVGNFSSGTPTAEDWKRPAARKMLEALDSHRETAILGLHEYACGVITSGFIGGEPGFIQRDTWPKSLADVTQWHCGRFQFLLEACDYMAIRAPRLIITEHGFDDMSDISMWTRTLVKTPPYENIRGWKSLWNQWRVWWNCNAEKAYTDQLIYADKTIYANTPVEAQLIFSWGASSEQWQQFNIEDASELQALLVDYAKPVVVTPPALNSEPILGEYNLITVPATLGHVNLRGAADPHSLDLGDVVAGDIVYVYPASKQTINGFTWVRVDHWRGTDKRNTGYMAVLLGVQWAKAEKPVTPEKSAQQEFDEIYDTYRAALSIAQTNYEAAITKWKQKHFNQPLTQAA